jgi:uncharacterized protein with GYD domain
MHYVLLAKHSPEQCPTSNAKIKQLLLDMAPDIPNIAQKAGVSITAGPYVNREHSVVTIVDADRPEDVDRFLVESRIAQWNRVRILPSLKMDEAMDDVKQQESLF